VRAFVLASRRFCCEIGLHLFRCPETELAFPLSAQTHNFGYWHIVRHRFFVVAAALMTNHFRSPKVGAGGTATPNPSVEPT